MGRVQNLFAPHCPSRQLIRRRFYHSAHALRCLLLIRLEEDSCHTGHSGHAISAHAPHVKTACSIYIQYQLFKLSGFKRTLPDNSGLSTVRATSSRQLRDTTHATRLIWQRPVGFTIGIWDSSTIHHATEQSLLVHPQTRSIVLRRRYSIAAAITYGSSALCSEPAAGVN